MNRFPTCRFLALCALTLSASAAFAQHHETPSPAPHHTADAPGKADARIGDPYPFETCPTTGKKLGSMGDPVVKVYEGREVRFCCPACPPKFEKDLTASLAALDAKIAKDQTPLYPLKTSVVTGKDLPEKPVDFVYANRLVRLGAESEKADFLKDSKKYLAALDKAVVEKQGKGYPLTKCPVSGEALGGDMGAPVDTFVAGRLLRLCCSSCLKDVAKDPARYIAIIDAAQKGEKAKPAAPAPAKPADPHSGH